MAYRPHPNCSQMFPTIEFDLTNFVCLKLSFLLSSSINQLKVLCIQSVKSHSHNPNLLTSYAAAPPKLMTQFNAPFMVLVFSC